MKLSIVIVNYNVEYFLEQCILSVIEASKGLEVETILVDNASVDGSIQMVQQKFPQVILIENKDNVGFSKANNQAMRVAKGEYVLLLNPDTVIEEDTLVKCIKFMDAHPNCGGLGVKMVDGKGRYLPESKRGLPDPQTSLYKLTGLNRLFPKSKRINKYYLGHLDKEHTHEIEILSGAFMWMRKSVLDQVGLLDESFFMYGEDIDLSYRITLGGYKNYYLPSTTIIHYKGESTKKGSLNYVFVFYKAMVIFAKKHFSSKNAKIYGNVINTAIWLKAGWSIAVGFVKKIALPILEAAVIFGVLSVALQYYGKWQEIIYDQNLVRRAFLAISGIYVLSLYVNKSYRKPWKIWNITTSIIIGFIIALGAYSLMPDSIRFSRAIILLSPVLALVSVLSVRGLLNLINKHKFPFSRDRKVRFGIIGDAQEYERVQELISQTRSLESDYVHIDTNKDADKIAQLDELIKVYNLNEVVFCAANISSSEIIKLMSISSVKNVDFKIAPPESLYIIGSNSVDRKGDLFILDVNSISKLENVKKKRIFDLTFSVLGIVLSPIFVLISGSFASYFTNVFKVIAGKYTLVGYGGSTESYASLPVLKTCVIPISKSSLPAEITHKLNVLYARDYKWRNDFITVIRNLRVLGVKIPK